MSAHVVIAADGTIAECVAPELEAWHAGWHNSEWLGVELVQPHAGDPIAEAQYLALAWWLQRMASRFDFPLSPTTLPEHRETSQGKAQGKSDIGPPFSLGRLLEMYDSIVQLESGGR